MNRMELIKLPNGNLIITIKKITSFDRLLNVAKINTEMKNQIDKDNLIKMWNNFQYISVVQLKDSEKKVQMFFSEKFLKANDILEKL